MSAMNSSSEVLAPNHSTLELFETEKTDNSLPPSDNFLANFLQKSHDAIEGFFGKRSAFFERCLYISMHLVLIGYFAWATQYFLKNSLLSLDATTCQGFGFLMILFIIVNYCILYYWLLKPYVVPAINKTIWQPLKRFLGPILAIENVQIGLYLLLLVAVLAYLVYDTADNRQRLVPLIGVVAFLLFGFVFCKHPKHIKWRPVIWGLILQFFFGLLTIRWEVGRNVFECLGDKVTTFLSYSNNGSAFVYGDFIVFEEKVFAFQAISTIFFLGFIINIFYHYGLMQSMVVSIGSFLQNIMGTTICESVNSAANIFLGQSEAPLLLRPYLENLTPSEVHSIMVSGFATVSGTVLAAYISFGASASHLITSSVMSSPAALSFSKLIYPETEKTAATKESIKLSQSEYSSVLDAACKGATQAMDIVLGIISNLIAFIACIYFINGVLEWFGILVGFDQEYNKWSATKAVGFVFIPISFIMGVPWEECELVGRLIGIKTMVNEFAAFKEMSTMVLTPRAKIIATYSICGFGNPGSIGIMISALSTLMPSKRHLVTDSVFRAFVSGAIVCFMTACIAAMLVPD